MRGNWGTAGPLAHALNPQQQQQQQQQQPEQQQQHTIVEEQHQSLHSSTTTPAWGIADRSVKEEPMEDKNNDSGVSPDHYTSSTANSSFSPSSATSQDSNTMQCNTFDYTPQGMFKNCASLPEQAMDVVSSTAKSSPEDTKFDHDILQCPVCAFTSVSRLQFSEHLSTHCSKKSDAPEFVKSVLEQLIGSGSQQIDARSSPTQGERSEQESEETEEPGLRVPRMNSQGKVKTFRCKQCSFVAITKMEFWEHSRSHIKAEKLLTCPKCPFVTEYKHHLEYHLRNHFGSKPFKCELCTYSCVNKSMLNSHLKSHSNIYQYRCANCSYATKYCHSLKLHLRKYSHQPAMVLNADGSPNPLPIIDVYGTRRGPKQKPIKHKQLKQEVALNSAMATNNNLQALSSSQLAPIGDNLPHNPMNGMHGMNAMNVMNAMNGMNGIDGMNVMNGMNGMNGMNPMGSLNGVVQNQPMMPFPYNQLFSRYPMGQFPASVDSSAMKQVRSTSLVDYSKSISVEGIMEDLPQNLVIKCVDGNRTPNGFPNELEGNEASNTRVVLYSPSLLTEETPLDLSKQNTTSHAQNKPATNSIRATGTSRRKGKAVKLDRRVVEEDTDEEQQRPSQEIQTMQEKCQGQPEDKVEPSSSNDQSSNDQSSNDQSSNDQSSNDPSSNDPSSNDPSSTGPTSSGPISNVPSSSGAKDNDDNKARSCSTEFNCKYCEIGFGNVVMYTVHMGYHGYSDPYTCNMCGFKCTEKVSFFLHIARSKHA